MAEALLPFTKAGAKPAAAKTVAESGSPLAPATVSAGSEPFMGLTGGKRENLQWTQGTLSIFKSSNMAERGFCRDCGTPLTYAFEGTGNISVTINSLDDPEAMPPTLQYGVESKVAWVDGVHKLPAQTSLAWLKEKAGQLVSNQHPDKAD